MLWTPSTCNPNTSDSCEIEITNNWEFVAFVKKCSAHQSITDNAAGFSVFYTPQITGENQRGPHNSIAEILDKGPAGLSDISAEGVRSIKAGITISWSWSGLAPNRVLAITVTGITLTTNQRNNIQTALNNRFGNGKIILQ